MNICQECKANLKEEEVKNHPYCHCMIAKAYPLSWRQIIKKIIDFNNDFQD